MNKALKIGLITTGVAIPLYFGIRFYLRNKAYNEASARFKENDTEKKLIIMQILISKGEDPSDSNINQYMRYSIEELKAMLNQGVQINATGSEDSSGYYDYYSYFGPGDLLSEYDGYYSYDSYLV